MKPGYQGPVLPILFAAAVWAIAALVIWLVLR